jgi:hypothetical protein
MRKWVKAEEIFGVPSKKHTSSANSETESSNRMS